MGHFVQRPAHEHAVGLFRHVEEAVTEQEGVDEHGDCAEDHDRAHGDAALVGFAADHGFRGEDGGRAADRTARRGEQGQTPGKPEHLDPEPRSADERTGEHDGTDGKTVEADQHQVLKGEAEAVQHDGDAKQHL